MSKRPFPDGFEKQFSNSAAAYEFFQQNKDNVAAGCSLGIPYHNTSSVRVSKIGVEQIERTPRGKEKSRQIYGSDYLPGGVNGIINHADGKRYDSKSAYEKAVRAKGCRVIGNDYKNQDLSRKEVYGDFNVKPDLARATKQVLEQHNGR